ncbi:SUR7-domain-containing protein [Metschnikowia bicuspidata var. bicuspidata NRRL YB-4993]|uniref:SUR7-domain-containing protein n=1 Tax=Metschnikowia bicuspidata var. bicuspidata NRRL YB-4993 TaxID=869754 RepID=A0A1A0HC98_9ASCO|nr:SUR7-domain-containing protein [Metschnikowia bicuspidata var. bicuspidata NRRL YB-4993]OBA21497.1 SUR7-domain-containing protein [Metschnikowia bicuspidata var. bicuspidata NRRL YB-4993]
MLRQILSLVAFLCATGAVVAMIFVNISGSSTSSVIRRFYFSELEGNYRWTMYGLCQTNDDGVYECSAPAPAYPYSPADNFSFTNLPLDFSTNRDTYYYLLRIAYGFFLVALLFSVLAAILVVVPKGAASARPGSPSTTVLFMAFLFATTACVLNTVAHAKGVHEFVRAGFSATIGKDMFICMWAGTGLLLLCFICLGMRSRLDRSYTLHPKVNHA